MGMPGHRGASGDDLVFARRFVQSRLAGFEKDIRICLTGVNSKVRPGMTHAYFPALAACCATLEYLAALHRGNIHGLGWRQVADWARAYLPQPDYDGDTVRVLVEALWPSTVLFCAIHHGHVYTRTEYIFISKDSRVTSAKAQVAMVGPSVRTSAFWHTSWRA
jgi:hypothetical protein